MDKYISDLLATALIRPSSSPAFAGDFFVLKKDGTLCPYLDYRGLNNIMVQNRFPLSFSPSHLLVLIQFPQTLLCLCALLTCCLRLTVALRKSYIYTSLVCPVVCHFHSLLLSVSLRMSCLRLLGSCSGYIQSWAKVSTPSFNYMLLVFFVY